LVGGAAAYDDDFGNTFGSKAECLEWWGTYPEACSAEEDGGGGGGGGEEPAPDPEPQWPITFASSPGTITLTGDDGSSETMQASEQDSSPEGRGVEPSAQGCRTIDVTRDIQSSFIPFHWDHLGVFHHYVYWCWTYPRITQFYSFCWSDVQGWAVTDHGCRSSGNWYAWRGDDHGGRYSFQQADWGNCAFRYGCFNRIDPYIHIWINGNGTWTQTQGD
jgi:hypothetical protein